MNVEQISFAVPAIVAQNLAKRAGTLNIRAAEYARRLFEAAYAVRIAGERGLPVEDSALDLEVRQVFLLADCEADYIAEALAMPIERVTLILEGWRQAAREMSGQSRKAQPTSALAPEPQSSGRGRYSADEVDVIRNLWREGRRTAEIARMLDRTSKQIEKFAHLNRDICPARRSVGK